MKTSKRFDHLLHEFEQQGAVLGRHVKSCRSNERLARKNAYRMGMLAVEMLNDHMDELSHIVKQQKKTRDEYFDQWFAPINYFGQRRAELFHAVNLGITEKQYLTTDPAVFIATKEQKKPTVVPETPTKPAANIPVREQAKQLRAANKELHQLVRLLRKKMSEDKAYYQQRLKETEAKVVELTEALKRVHEVTLKAAG